MKAALIVLLALAASPICLLSQTVAASAHGMATVHLYRTGSHGNAIKVLIDRQEAFKLSNHEAVTFQLAAGEHEIAARYGDRRPMVTVNLKAGREYFLQLAFKVHRAGAVFGIVDPADALELDLIRQPGFVDADASMKEHPLDPGKLSWIASLQSPVQDP